MSRVIFVSIASFALLFATVVTTNVKQCKTGPFPLSVNIEGCTEPPCIVIRGSTLVMEVTFVGTKNDMRNITTKVRATALGITFPYELPDEVADVCSNLMYEAQCPIDKSEDVTYKFNFFLDSLTPEISVKVEISLIDVSDGETIACFICDAKVRKGTINPLA